MLMTFMVLAEIDFSAPTAFGVPLGTLLLFLLLWKMLREGGASHSSGGGTYTSENTMDVQLRNEVGEDVVQFQHSQAKVANGQCVVIYTVKIKKTGSYVIAGGKAESGYFNKAYLATRTVSGDAGDVISGAVSCSAFHEGIWGVGAFHSASDVPKI